MNCYELVESDNGCHYYRQIRDLSTYSGEIHTPEKISDMCGKVGRTIQPQHLTSDVYVYVPGSWDIGNIAKLVAMYKKKIGKKFPRVVYMDCRLGMWCVPQYIQDAVVTEIQKIFPKKYKFVDNALHLIDPPLLSYQELVKILNRVTSEALYRHVNDNLSIRNSDNSTGGLETSIKVNIVCGVTLHMIEIGIDLELQQSCRTDDPMYKKYRKQIIALYKQLSKNKKIQTIGVTE